ncbi:prephenate dehydrogenase [Candidatus Omnitrophota bacterium]
MKRQGFLFNRVSIIGVGLIGGSLGMAIKKQKVAKEVIGFARRKQTIREALKKKAIDRGTLQLSQAVSNADLVIFATPVDTIIRLAPLALKNLKKGCIVTDVGSCKNKIVQAIEKRIPTGIHFVGSHPLAGSEKKGVRFAGADLYKNSVCILTPTNTTNQSAFKRIKKFWMKLGARTHSLSPSRHDRILAYISHLPHMLAFSLVAAVPEEYFHFASGGMRDTSRIAASDAAIWRDIFIANKKEVKKALKVFRAELSDLERMISSRNRSRLTKKLLNAKIKREKLKNHT